MGEESIILASASPRRALLLKKARIPFKVCVPKVREAVSLSKACPTPRKLALWNACKKSKAVAKKFPNHCVLGADTIVVLGKKIFGKPKNFSDAERMLAQLVGRTHRVITAVCLCHGKKARQLTVSTKVTFKKMTEDGIRKYLKRIKPLDKVGAYAAQNHPPLQKTKYGFTATARLRKGEIIQRIEGSFTNVVGLPMEALLKKL